MKRHALVTGLIALGFLAGCTSSRDDVASQRQNVQETQQEAAKDVRETQTQAVKDINEQKQESSQEVRDAQRDLQEAQREQVRESAGTVSGATTATDRQKAEVKVTAEECARLAQERDVKPENKAKYEACSKMNR